MRFPPGRVLNPFAVLPFEKRWEPTEFQVSMEFEILIKEARKRQLRTSEYYDRVTDEFVLRVFQRK